jgi:hypothetical protein
MKAATRDPLAARYISLPTAADRHERKGAAAPRRESAALAEAAREARAP